MPTASELYDQAIQLQEAGKLEEAIGRLEQLAVEQPDFALAQAALAAFYGKLGRHEDAVARAQRVCELEPQDPFSFMAMSLICQRAGRIGEAESAMSQAMELQWAAHNAGAEGAEGAQ